jgi:hypothetical protein
MENTAPQISPDSDNTDNLAEKCRTSLEKKYGFKIPLPKSVNKSKPAGKRFVKGVLNV